MPDKLRFGLIGCGAQGRYLSEALLVGGRAILVACTDVNPAAAKLAVEQCGYKQAYTDSREMLSNEPLDAVVVATTHDQLKPSAMTAVRAGKHVLIEKPMALSAAEGRELVTAAKEANVKLMVGYTLRFLPERVRLKQLLDAGTVGDTVHVLAGQLISPMSGWLIDPKHGGGPLFYIGTHVIDQVLWVVEREPKRVFAELQRPAEDTVETDALITISFDGNVAAQICCSQRLGGRYGWIDVLGSAGRLRAEWESNVIYVESRAVYAYRNPTLIHVPIDDSSASIIPQARASLSSYKYIRAWAAELLDFITAITEDRNPSVTGEDGVRVLEVTDAIFESGRTGLPIDLK